MSAGLSVCVVLLVVLCSTSLGLPFSSHGQHQDQGSPSQEGTLTFPPVGVCMCNICFVCGAAHLEGHTLDEAHLRHGRSAPHQDAESRANLSQLLATLISSRKGSVRRNSSSSSRGGGVSIANQRRADGGDYLGWMDFGKRSAEEYEYSS
ncbi:cholecystokinin-like isoform X1 [Entelurus aequoreus]|uniref:cholecystokinin-like isoform X1 n=1 Tax=Entelurus aequoreus TaxID=161455 RepID=UPI002B1CE840|nr:cholecystokinin-like isoform X1 [Entelurus aequoreus]